MTEMNEKPIICKVCDHALVESDGFWSCPVYMVGKDKSADEHTSYPAEEE